MSSVGFTCCSSSLLNGITGQSFAFTMIRSLCLCCNRIEIHHGWSDAAKWATTIQASISAHTTETSLLQLPIPNQNNVGRIWALSQSSPARHGFPVFSETLRPFDQGCFIFQCPSYFSAGEREWRSSISITGSLVVSNYWPACRWEWIPAFRTETTSVLWIDVCLSDAEE